MCVEKKGNIAMTKFKTFFNLNRPYQFDITDITSIIYTLCAAGVIMGYDMTILFVIGAIISTAFCWQARKLNLILLNVSLLIMNLFYLFT